MAVARGEENERLLKKDNNKLFKSFRWKTKMNPKTPKHCNLKVAEVFHWTVAFYFANSFL